MQGGVGEDPPVWRKTFLTISQQIKKTLHAEDNTMSKQQHHYYYHQPRPLVVCPLHLSLPQDCVRDALGTDQKIKFLLAETSQETPDQRE